MATLRPFFTHVLSLSSPLTDSRNSISNWNSPTRLFSTAPKRRAHLVGAVAEDQEEAAPAKPRDSKARETLSGFLASLAGAEGEESDRSTRRAINAAIVLGFGTFAVTKLFTIDNDYWHCFSGMDTLRSAKICPEHNWIAYEQALKSNPVLAKMAISGSVYAIGDWIAQCYEGKPIFEFELKRVLRSGLVGFVLHGSLSHYYYQFCEALFPYQDWWVVPAKVAFDQTVWSAVWNCIYYFVLGILRFESPADILVELKATFWPLLTAGWKLWPFAHLITYGVVPIEQRLLWVDCIELIWVTILSTYSNEKSESRTPEAPVTASSTSETNERKE